MEPTETLGVPLQWILDLLCIHTCCNLDRSSLAKRMEILLEPISAYVHNHSFIPRGVPEHYELPKDI